MFMLYPKDAAQIIVNKNQSKKKQAGNLLIYRISGKNTIQPVFKTIVLLI